MRDRQRQTDREKEGMGKFGCPLYSNLQIMWWIQLLPERTKTK